MRCSFKFLKTYGFKINVSYLQFLCIMYQVLRAPCVLKNFGEVARNSKEGVSFHTKSAFSPISDLLSQPRSIVETEWAVQRNWFDPRRNCSFVLYWLIQWRSSSGPPFFSFSSLSSGFYVTELWYIYGHQAGSCLSN